jgi:hypothetical protein
MAEEKATDGNGSIAKAAKTAARKTLGLVVMILGGIIALPLAIFALLNLAIIALCLKGVPGYYSDNWIALMLEGAGVVIGLFVFACGGFLYTGGYPEDKLTRQLADEEARRRFKGKCIGAMKKAGLEAKGSPGFSALVGAELAEIDLEPFFSRRDEPDIVDTVVAEAQRLADTSSQPS